MAKIMTNIRHKVSPPGQHDDLFMLILISVALPSLCLSSFQKHICIIHDFGI